MQPRKMVLMNLFAEKEWRRRCMEWTWTYLLSLFFKGGHLFLNRELYTNDCLLSFSHSVVSNSLRPHGLQHARLHCPSPSPGAHSILHHLPELIQTHVYRVSDAIQPSDPLSSPSLPAFNLNQHQGLF